MENLEVILCDVDKQHIDSLFFQDLKIAHLEVLSSHFFDKNNKKDIELHELNSLLDIFSEPGTGNIHLDKVNLGIELHDVVVVISFDEEYGDIVFNFHETCVFQGSRDSTMLRCMSLFKYLIVLLSKYKFQTIRFGYDSAYDDDTCIAKIDNTDVDLNSIVASVLLSYPSSDR